MNPKTKLLSLASVAAVGLASCASDELKEAYVEEGISFTSRVTRATETNLGNLKAFYVYAEAEGYNGSIINGLKAESTDKSGEYVLEEKKTWPTDVETISFWAYGPDNVELTPAISQSSQMLTRFSVPTSLEKGGAEQKDLVMAYSKVSRENVKGGAVPLNFKHALSQIEINIKKGDGYEEGRMVKVKGAWIINVHDYGSQAVFSANETDNSLNIEWTTGFSKENSGHYGRLLSNGTYLGTGVNIIGNKDGSENSSLMLLPQSFVKYDFTKNIATVDDKASATNKAGTYILVLCRIETWHNYPATEAGTEEHPAIGTTPDGNGHIHQLFPVSKNEAGDLIYDEKAYGYSCVPIEGNWEPGKKYVYTLEFCGKDSGGGQYPPEELPDGLPEDVPPRPDDKKPGDPVLDDPIKFSVTVSDWQSNEDDAPTPML